MATEPPLVVIAGPTASGKTSLAIKLAKKFGGEIISADSRAIFRGLTIGTAKPLEAEMEGVAHWGIDLVDPGQRFTVAGFQAYTMKKIREIRSRNHIPFLVGGTGLYINSVVYEYQFPPGAKNDERRTKFESMSIEELHVYCGKNNVPLPENDKNKRYVINAILRNGHTAKRRDGPIDNCIIVGITTKKDILAKRIHERAEVIFDSGVIEEARRAAHKWGWDSEAMTGNIYPVIRRFIEGEISLDEAKRRFEVLDWRLAKRQLTWLKRDEHIRWMTLDQAYTYLAQRLVAVNKS